jgi:hypothetical protein
MATSRNKTDLYVACLLAFVIGSGCSRKAASPAEDAHSASAGTVREPRESPNETAAAPAVHERPFHYGPFDWNVKVGDDLGPGPNRWSNALSSVWVDEDGLHLRLTVIGR